MGMLRPEDDYLHPGSTDPYWNESGWFAFMAPERSLHGAVYLYHRPNMGYTVGGTFVWDPSGRDMYDCLFYDWGMPHATPQGSDMFDVELPANGLNISCVKPLRSYRLRYGSPERNWYLSQGCRLDLQFEGFHEPHQSMMPKGQNEWGGDPESGSVEGRLVNGHYRQMGRVQGTVELNGEHIEIDSYSMRDHSWGPRRFKDNPRGSACWAIAGEDHYFQVMGVAATGPEEDPVDGAVDVVLNGAYMRDGVLSDVTSGRVVFQDRESDGSPRSYAVEFTDQLGREVRATGVTKSVLKWTGYPMLMMWWPQVEWTFDGVTAFGEGQDWWPMQHGRRYLRSRCT